MRTPQAGPAWPSQPPASRSSCSRGDVSPQMFTVSNTSGAHSCPERPLGGSCSAHAQPEPARLRARPAPLGHEYDHVAAPPQRARPDPPGPAVADREGERPDALRSASPSQASDADADARPPRHPEPQPRGAGAAAARADADRPRPQPREPDRELAGASSGRGAARGPAVPAPAAGRRATARRTAAGCGRAELVRSRVRAVVAHVPEPVERGGVAGLPGVDGRRTGLEPEIVAARDRTHPKAAVVVRELEAGLTALSWLEHALPTLPR